MRTLKVWSLVLVCLAARPLIADAQQPDGKAPPPPQLENLEEGEEAPAITIRKPEGGSRSEEKRAPGGKVTEIKVSSGGSTYYLKPNDQAGSAAPGDIQGSMMRAAQWEILTFDLGRPEQSQPVEDAEGPAPLPPGATEPPDRQKK
ncbi:DUF2782 domain-containing protein [Noviherbaspirillum massiliense]|uniref:DUF2782 domain-containing protein n=1 Tax=Noviherbaspirillum massiliense TaxID=1465823 RepID=UPI0002DA17D6|nr:DUF2782 domain-containing protein [Noviherbaspirillum massiliense]